MPTLQQEREHLAKADQHIAEGQQRATEQEIRIAKMEGRGTDTRRAREILKTLEAILEQWRRSRQLILEEIARLTVP